MKIYGAILALSLLSSAAFSVEKAVGDDVFPSPYLNADRTIQVVAPRAVETVVASDPSITVYVFRDAKTSCELDGGRLNSTFQELLKLESKVYQTLENLFEYPYASAQALGLTILIDDFGSNRKNFNSMYLPALPGHQGPVILLDCSIAAQVFWQSSVTHELTHALLHSENIDSWFEEGLAQLMEKDAGGVQPDREMELFRQTTLVPTLLEQRRPFPMGANYAITYLFLKYLKANFGDWPLLKAMTGLSSVSTAADSTCRNKKTFYEHAVCLGQEFLMNDSPLSSLAEKMTPQGIFRFFSVAMTLNESSFPLYSIPDWKGFMEPFDMKSLVPYSFSKVSVEHINSGFDSRLESYFITQSGDRFSVAPFSLSVVQENNLSDGFVLLMNMTEATIDLSK
jgi:hypothetical protein